MLLTILKVLFVFSALFWLEVYRRLRETLVQKNHYQTLGMHERVQEVLDVKGSFGLDGYSFFGLNVPAVVHTLESDRDSIYHAIPPANFPPYRYHMVTQNSARVIRVREERVCYTYYDYKE